MHYTDAMVRFLSKNRTLPLAERTVRFNKEFGTEKTPQAIDRACARKGWFTGRTGYFKKGEKPWNAGTKGVCKKNKGSFSKGIRPWNWRPIGSERVDNHDGYVLVKVAEPKVWRQKHVVVWESVYGKVKKGHIVRFRDNNKLNCAIENLEEVTRGVHLYLNKIGYHQLPDELKPVMKAIAEVDVKIFEIQNKKLAGVSVSHAPPVKP